MTDRQIILGGATYSVRPFSPRKALIAGRMLKNITGSVSQVLKRMAEFRQEYRITNAQFVTRSMAALEPWKAALDHMTIADWEKAGGQVELRLEPSDIEVAVDVFPLAFELAEDEVKKLLALILIPNQDLGRAALAGEGIDAALEPYGNKILDEASIAELVELVDLATQVVKDELMAQPLALERLRALWTGKTTPATDDSPTETIDSAPPEEASSTSASSSTDSPAATDGTTEPSSTGSRGEPAPVSAS